MAGHEQISDTVIIDTHGEAVIDQVFDLFEYATGLLKPIPVLLERDFNIPELEELQGEITRMETIVSKTWKKEHAIA